MKNGRDGTHVTVAVTLRGGFVQLWPEVPLGLGLFRWWLERRDEPHSLLQSATEGAVSLRFFLSCE